MKKIFLFFTSLAALAGCSNEELSSSMQEQTDEITFSSVVQQSEQGQTRTTNLNLQSTQIVAGQNVGVYVTGSNPTMTNGKWLVGSNGTMTNQGTSIYWTGTSSIAVKAYQPYMTDSQLKDAKFSVLTDQSSDKNYQQSDLLYATKESSRTSSAVPLTFYHKLSKVMVKLVPAEGTSLSGAQVYVCNTQISTAFNPQNLSIAATGTATDIKAATVSTSVPTAAAITMPQTVTAGTNLIRVDVDGRTYYYALKNNVTFVSGYSYLYTLGIDLSYPELTLVSTQILDWNNESDLAVNLTADGTYTPEEENHEYVDLGLSVLWATCNMGATSPEGYGNYYAWGETIGYAANAGHDFSWTNYKYANGTYNSLTKYNTSSTNGTVDNVTALVSSDDAAVQNWGGEWRMPTSSEMDELRTNCTWTATNQNNVYGYRVTGTNGKSIFLPAAGYYKGTAATSIGTYLYYWSKTINSSTTNSYRALTLFNSSSLYNTDRAYGLTIRPVRSK